MDSLLARIRTFCADFETGQRRPQVKWMRDMFGGSLMSDKGLRMAEIARVIDDLERHPVTRDLVHTQKRLSRNLVGYAPKKGGPRRDPFDDAAWWKCWWTRVTPYLNKDEGKGLVMCVDYTDVSKPYSKPEKLAGMEYACVCRDGSSKKMGVGYPVVQMEASMPDGHRMPVWYHLFSYTEPGWFSEPRTFIDCLEQAAPRIGKQAWWAFDRAFHADPYFDSFDELGLRWVVRLKLGKQKNEDGSNANSQVFILDDGTETDVRSLLKLMKANPTVTDTRVRSSKKGRTIHISYCKVFLHNKKNKPYRKAKGSAKTLVVIQEDWKLDKDMDTTVLLASEWLGTDDHAREVARVYDRRWDCEESTRTMKGTKGWGLDIESMCSLKIRGMRRLLMFAQMVYLFVYELRSLGRGVLARIAQMARLTKKEVADDTYRLIRGLGAMLSRAPKWRILDWLRGP